MEIRKAVFQSVIFSIILFISITGICAQETSQSGYIITNSNDTIRGYIQNINIGQFTKCSFKKNKKSPTIDYLPGEIAAYRFDGDGKFFISKEIPVEKGSKILFLEYLIKGKANIYFMRDNTDHYYIQKEDDKLIELTEPPQFSTTEEGVSYNRPQKYTGKLKYLLADCPQIYSEIDGLKLYPTQLIKLAKDYHEKVCDSEKCIVFERKIKPVKVNIGVLAGVSNNDFIFASSDYTDKRSGSFVGCKIELENLIFSSERVTLNTGFIYQYFSTYNFFHIQENYYNVLLPVVTDMDMNMKASTVRIPLTINYMFTQGKLRPYIGGGITSMFFLSQNKSLYVHEFNDYFGQTVPFFHIGIVGTTGLKYQLKNNRSVFLEFNYETIQNMNINQNININEILRIHNQILSIETGFMF